MSTVPLVHSSETRQVEGVHLVNKCSAFRTNLTLLAQPYSIRSAVSPASFKDFSDALEDAPITITSENFCDLTQLCQEFGYEELGRRVTEFRESSDSTVPTRELLNAIARVSQLEHQVAALETQNRELIARIDDLATEVGYLREGNAASRAEPQPSAGPIVPGWDSLIVPEFPTQLLRDFRKKRFRLLWRGTRDTFSANQFHSRCDGRSNTLTIIMDSSGSVFGGFTPVAWDCSNTCKNDTSGRSFLFTLKNPSGVERRKFGLANPAYAIYCNADRGPTFGNGCDIYVASNSDANQNSSTNLGTGYVNYTGREGSTVFTGSPNFRAREIEVFEITG
jgi:hypothetical protein